MDDNIKAIQEEIKRLKTEIKELRELIGKKDENSTSHIGVWPPVDGGEGKTMDLDWN